MYRCKSLSSGNVSSNLLVMLIKIGTLETSEDKYACFVGNSYKFNFLYSSTFWSMPEYLLEHHCKVRDVSLNKGIYHHVKNIGLVNMKTNLDLVMFGCTSIRFNNF
jgi:hypothetical protein